MQLHPKYWNLPSISQFLVTWSMATSNSYYGGFHKKRGYRLRVLYFVRTKICFGLICERCRLQGFKMEKLVLELMCFGWKGNTFGVWIWPKIAKELPQTVWLWLCRFCNTFFCVCKILILLLVLRRTVAKTEYCSSRIEWLSYVKFN